MSISLVEKKFGVATDVQRRAMPLVAEGRNVLILAPTGSGKTEAAAIPIMKRIADEKLPGIAALYITPLRALNRDLLKRLTEWARELGVTIAVRHGDTPQSERALQARIPPQFLITTPETLQAILPAKRVGLALRNVKFVLVDEIHELCDDKRGVQLSLGLERLAEKAGEFQRIGISATVADPHIVSRFLCGFRNCEIVDLNYTKSMKFEVLYPKPNSADEHIANELLIDTSAAARLREIKNIIADKKTLIFVNTRSIAEILGSRLMKLNDRTAVHHGSLSREARIQIEDDFKNGHLSALVATSSLELGIDIGDVNHVIQYMSPRQASRLIQRVGRSGHTIRGTSTGTIICADPDDILEATAIIELINNGILDAQQIYTNALDVLAQQIAGVLLERSEILPEVLFDFIKRAYPYATLSSDEFISLIDFLIDRRLIKKTLHGTLQKTSRTREYYYSNLSMIPSVEKFVVKDATTNKIVSTLDEDFVAFLENGDMFITKGIPWRILDVDNDKRMVVAEPTEEISAAIPDWEGEEIPTSFEVCQKVGELRRRIINEEPSIKPLTKDASEIVTELREFDKGCVPDEHTLYIEEWGDAVVLHILGGLKVNRTIATIIGERLANDYGASLRTLVDPYRIAFVFPRDADAHKVHQHLFSIINVEEELRAVLPKTQLFKHIFIRIGKKFNLFKEETPKLSERFLLLFKGLPPYVETEREILQTYFDVKRAAEILNMIHSKLLKVIHRSKKTLTSIGMRAFHRYHGAELIAPIEPTSEIVKAFKNRLLARKTILCCTYCNHDWMSFVGTLPQKIVCPRCGSKMITLCDNIDDTKLMKKKGKLTDAERKKKEQLLKSAAIIAASGKMAAVALSTYGVGPKKVATILSKNYRTEDEFFATLLEAQKTFIRTKRYWEFH